MPEAALLRVPMQRPTVHRKMEQDPLTTEEAEVEWGGIGGMLGRGNLHQMLSPSSLPDMPLPFLGCVPAKELVQV